jgi:hypothetical protein
MKIFLLDLWHDLREKRLWPVALVLAVALVAVPVVLSKPAAEPPPPAPAPQETRSEQDLKGLAKVVLANEDAGKGSKLNLFDPSNPFKPPKPPKEEQQQQSDGGGTPGTGSAVGESVSGGAGGSLGGGGIGGETTPPPAQPVAPSPPKTTQFTYVIDVTFTRGERTRKIKGMERLEMLPNESEPLLLFLGVDAKADNAVFLVDSRLKPTGEGKCKPSADDCSFLYLGAGSEHFFTDEEGETYTLRVDEIRRVKVSKTKSSRARAGKHRRKRHKSARRSAYRPEGERRPFLPPLLTDLVTVSSGQPGPSSTDDSRR